MTSIWFAIGAAAALISCLFTDLFRVQALLFIVVSVLCLLAFRPLAAKLRKAPTATNGDRNLGREATVLPPVTAEEPGRVRLDGVDWNARCVTPGDILTPASTAASPRSTAPCSWWSPFSPKAARPDHPHQQRRCTMVLFFVILALVFVVLLVIITNIRIVQQSRRPTSSSASARTARPGRRPARQDPVH